MDGKRRNTRTRFFKVLICDDFDTQLRIPPAFVINHLPGLITPKRFKLSNCAGRFWHVNIEKVDDCLFFTRGWKAFAQDNSLQFGDFLVFRFNGVSKFSVRAYGLHACEKEVPSFARKRKCGESDQINKNNPTGNMHGEERGGLHSLGPDPKHEDSNSVSEPGEDAEETLNYLDVNGVVHPCFKVVVTSNSLRNHRYLRIPLLFIESYIKTGEQTAKLQYADRLWPVREDTDDGSPNRVHTEDRFRGRSSFEQFCTGSLEAGFCNGLCLSVFILATYKLEVAFRPFILSRIG
ncbi:hypothetical protein BT93_H1149 [Corymbia citriodora subsp. variegata]|nr:hypothetical protein BT93_H1149 [Corymbia citriodora subsp. variegata]